MSALIVDLAKDCDKINYGDGGQGSEVERVCGVVVKLKNQEITG